MYLLPNLSINEITASVPRAFIPAKGKASISKLEGSFSSPKPRIYKIFGPKYITVLIPESYCQNYKPAPIITHFV